MLLRELSEEDIPYLCDLAYLEAITIEHTQNQLKNKMATPELTMGGSLQ